MKAGLTVKITVFFPCPATDDLTSWITLGQAPEGQTGIHSSRYRVTNSGLDVSYAAWQWVSSFPMAVSLAQLP